MIDKTTREWMEYYENLEKKNWQAYQESGESRYDRAQYKYSKIVDAFRAKLDDEVKSGYEQKKRMANRDGVINHLIKDTYTRDEVIKLLNDAVWW